MKKPTEDEIRVVMTIFKLDPYNLVAKEGTSYDCGRYSGYCHANAKGSHHGWCTRPPNHEGPHIVLVHDRNACLNRSTTPSIEPSLGLIWYD